MNSQKINATHSGGVLGENGFSATRDLFPSLKSCANFAFFEDAVKSCS